MGLVECHVDRIDVQTVPKFVLFGGRNETDRAESTASNAGESDRNLPVSPAQVLAVTIGATLLAFALAKAKGIVEDNLSFLW